jgi:Glycosyl hydrolase family 20, domain 2/Glycosyl hydrolase family 20, catalytic domain
MRWSIIPVALLLAWTASGAEGIFPKPQEAEPAPGSFLLDSSVVIALAPQASAADRSLANLLGAELTDRFELALRQEPLASLAAGRRYIVMGSAANASLGDAAAKSKLAIPGAEGYVLEVTADRILIAGADDAGAFYGLQSLRQVLGPAGTRIPGARVRDWPASPFRGIKMYLPGREHIPFFKRFVRDFMAQYKFNRLILEMNGAMRLDRHPEINAGWLELNRDLFATRRERPSGPHGEQQDSVHHDTADGGILEKSEVADLAAWARQNHVEVIPEIPSLTHSYYLLARHHELAEIPNAEWPDTYCPSLAASYRLVFDVLDEYIDVLKPAMVHIGHDEWRIPWGVCQRCRDKDPRQLFADDVNKIYAHVKSRGVRVAMWGDHLIEPLRGVRLKDRQTRDGYAYQAPGALSPEQVLTLIPKDIVIFNWFWDDSQPGQGEADDRRLSEWGFQQVYGNMTPGIPNYAARSRSKGVIGGAPSSWAATTPLNFGKDLVDQFLGCASMLWARESLDPAELRSVLDRELPRIAESFQGKTPWSVLTEPVLPVTMPAGAAPPQELRLPELKHGKVQAGKYVFDVGRLIYAATRKQGPVDASPAIEINQDASSLVFLHASAARGASRMAYTLPHDFADTADLLGWYEVVYEDGYIITAPVRSEVNILEWNRDSRPNQAAYAFETSPVEIGTGAGRPVTFYAWEWTNPRLGKVIREVRLKGTSGFRRFDGTPISNGIILAGISYVPKRQVKPGAKAGVRD